MRLQAGDNWIEVHADGRIVLDGQNITGLAADKVRLLGQTIELG